MRMTNDYHFMTQWSFDASINEVADILQDAMSLPGWWPSVYLSVEEIVPGDARGLGRVVRLYTKGWLPYTLRWQFEVTEIDYPNGFELRAWGDFNGRGVWTLKQVGSAVHSEYDWRISAEKPVLRRFSRLLKPLFAWNHSWAMARGEESLRLELQRRRCRTTAERERIPPPPGPTWPHSRAMPRASRR